MSDKKKLEKIYTVEEAPGFWPRYDQFETYEEAEESARKRSYSSGTEYLIMAPIARTKAPEEVNTVSVKKLT